MSAREDILRRFQPKVLTEQQAAEIEGIQSGFVDTADWILNATNPSREQRAALTALEEAAGWAIRAIEMHGPAPVTDEMRANLEAMLDDSYPSAPLGDGQGPATPTRMIDIVDSLVGTRGLTDSDEDAADAKVAHVTDLHPTKSPLARGGFTGGPGNYEAAGIVHRGVHFMPRALAEQIGQQNLDALNEFVAGPLGTIIKIDGADIARAANATRSLPDTNRGAA